ncbi:MAG: hypothetical protein EA412_13200 [Chitinophagaceae bacterium]|nr:MAG: hypothetical protein EA412_13200 [Chitinophagaceae bacterium]
MSVKNKILKKGFVWRTQSVVRALLLLTSVILFSCSPYKHLEENQKLYTGSSVKFSGDEEVRSKDIKRLESEIEKVLLPGPNKKVFKLFYARLWFYNIAGEPTGRGLRYLLRNRLGEEPVLIDEVNRERRLRLISNRAANLGFFETVVTDSLRTKNKRASIKYRVELTPFYTLDNIYRPFQDTSNFTRDIHRVMINTTLESGDQYNLNNLVKERQRIEEEMKEIGYYYFTANDLIFRADTTAGNRKVNLSLQYKEDLPQRNMQVFHINKMYLEINSDNTDRSKDTIVSDFYIIDPDKNYNPSMFSNLPLMPGERYSRSNHRAIYRQLMELGVFQFIQLQFREAGEGKLDLYMIATNFPKRSLSAELLAVTKSNNFTGPVLNSRVVNRNLFNRAEHFYVEGSFGFETQIGGDFQGLFAYDFSLETGLEFPRLLPRNFINQRNTWSLPKTTISAGFQLINRVGFFRMNNYNLRYQYSIPHTQTIRHVISPFQLRFLQLNNISDDFREELERNPFLERSFEEQFILGLGYSFFYNSQMKESRMFRHYLNVNIETAGNVLSGINSIVSEKNDEGLYTFIGSNFNQFIKSDFDYRLYWNLGEFSSSTLVFRLFAGAGLPYGNGEYLPYIYQFFTGGSNSIRAFRPRGLGPGSYAPEEEISYFDRTGEIKLESNIEYRFPISGMFKGAVFTDIGNIWQWAHLDVEEEKKFYPDDFYETLAVGAGIGLRIDLSFFVLRFDLAFPLRNPMLEEAWVISDINPFKREWLRENLILNIAIGYPF